MDSDIRPSLCVKYQTVLQDAKISDEETFTVSNAQTAHLLRLPSNNNATPSSSYMDEQNTSTLTPGSSSASLSTDHSHEQAPTLVYAKRDTDFPPLMRVR